MFSLCLITCDIMPQVNHQNSDEGNNIATRLLYQMVNTKHNQV